MPPIWKWYVRKPRKSKWKDVTVAVPPGVFHPGLFLSTRFLLRHLEQYELKGKRLLELGAGSGMIAIVSARRGALVTATDISRDAINCISANFASNHVTMAVIHSDLFAAIPSTPYDFIVINPPYYPANPSKDSEYAWFCGEHFEYFQRLFDGLAEYCHAQTRVLMVLSEDCKLREIGDIAAAGGWSMEIIDQRSRWGERNYIFKASRT